MSDTNAPTPPDDVPDDLDDPVRVVFEGSGPDAYVRLAEEDETGPTARGLVKVFEVPAYMWDTYRVASAQTASAYALMRRYVNEHAEREERGQR